MALILLVLNYMSSCFVIQLPGHLVNLIVLFFQLISGLCLTSQSWPKNMSILFKSVTAASSISLCPLILISKGTTLVTFLFFVLSVLKTSNEKFIGFVWILLSLTNCLSITVCVHLESTRALAFNFFPFFIFTSACTFNSHFPLLFRQFGIMYLFWDFTWEISYTVPTRDLCQNPPCSSHFHCLILSGPSFFHCLLSFVVSGDMSFLVAFEAHSGLSFFLLYLVFLCHMSILVVVEALQLPILKVLVGPSNVHWLSPSTIHYSSACLVIMAFFCGFISLSDWCYCHFPFFKWFWHGYWWVS